MSIVWGNWTIGLCLEAAKGCHTMSKDFLKLAFVWTANGLMITRRMMQVLCLLLNFVLDCFMLLDPLQSLHDEIIGVQWSMVVVLQNIAIRIESSWSI